jgi:hypothetical protein
MSKIAKFLQKNYNIEKWLLQVFPSDRSLFCGTAATSESAFIFGGRDSPKLPSDKMFRLGIGDRRYDFRKCF